MFFFFDLYSDVQNHLLKSLVRQQSNYFKTMKKFLLSLALMLMGSFAFANTNVVLTAKSESIVEIIDTYSFGEKDSKGLYFGTCYVTVKIYNQDGELLEAKLHAFYNVETEADCNNYATALRLHYLSQA